MTTNVTADYLINLFDKVDYFPFDKVMSILNEHSHKLPIGFWAYWWIKYFDGWVIEEYRLFSIQKSRRVDLGFFDSNGKLRGLLEVENDHKECSKKMELFELFEKHKNSGNPRFKRLLFFILMTWVNVDMDDNLTEKGRKIKQKIESDIKEYSKDSSMIWILYFLRYLKDEDEPDHEYPYSISWNPYFRGNKKKPKKLRLIKDKKDIKRKQIIY